MTDAPASVPPRVSQVFDAALVRGQTAMAEPLPVLRKVDPEKSAARNVAEMRRMLFSRFAYAVPAVKATELHSQSVKGLVRLERRFFWRRTRVAVADFLLSYGLAILSFLVAAGLVALAIAYREAIIGYVSELFPKAPAPTLPSASPANPTGPMQAPAGVAPPASQAGSTP